MPGGAGRLAGAPRRPGVEGPRAGRATSAGVQLGAGPAPERPGDVRAPGAGRVGGPHRRVAPRIRRACAVPVRAHPVPAARDPLRGHQGPSRGRHPAPAARGARHRAGRRPERRQRRAAAAMGIDGGAGPAVQLPGRFHRRRPGRDPRHGGRLPADVPGAQARTRTPPRDRGASLPRQSPRPPGRPRGRRLTRPAAAAHR